MTESNMFKLVRPLVLSAVVGMSLSAGSAAHAAIVSESFDTDAAHFTDVIATYPNLSVVGADSAHVEGGVLKVSTEGEVVGFSAPMVAGMADFGSTYTVSARIGGSLGKPLYFSPTLMISSNLGLEFGVSDGGNEYFRVIAADFDSNGASVGGIPVQVADIGFDIIIDQLYAVTATIQRNGDGTVTLDASIADALSSNAFTIATQVFSVEDAAALFGSYDSVGLRNRGNEGIALLDDLSVTFVPEPASLALMGLGGVLMLRRRRHA